MSKTCLTHKNTPAITMCTQCHKPICQSCTMITPAGRFCSSECSILYKEMKTKLGSAGGEKKSSGALKLIFVLLLFVAGAFVIHLAATDKKVPEDHWLKKIDVLGRLLDQQKK